MNKDDIISAAFKAWGREGYRKMSLSDVAAELSVTKPALYRHFRDKEVLFAEMGEFFFDGYVEALFRASPDGFAGAARDPRLMLRFAETLADYFGRRREALAYLFGRVMTSADPETLFREALAKRGFTPPAADAGATDEQRVRLGITVTTTFFLVALFHFGRASRSDESPSEMEISGLIESVRGVCCRGLGFAPGAILPAAYSRLDGIARLNAEETAAPNGLLPAVAAVVAEVGAWNASMEMVAKRSGLSKSGLYAHFKSKEDMLSKLFITEFERISAVMEDRCARVEAPAERLYVALATASSYLLARPDVLVALDWVRAQRLDLGHIMPDHMNRTFAFLKDGAESGRYALLPGGFPVTVRWVLFLTVHQLVSCKNSAIRGAARPADLPLKLRTLHAYILNGIGECER